MATGAWSSLSMDVAQAVGKANRQIGSQGDYSLVEDAALHQVRTQTEAALKLAKEEIPEPRLAEIRKAMDDGTLDVAQLAQPERAYFDVYTRGQRQMEALYEEMYQANPTEGGKRIDFDPAKWELLEVPGADEAQARAWFEAHDGAGYDLAGNLKFVWSWWPHSKSRWFCTEAIAAALGLPGKPHWYGPRKLAEAMTAMLARVDVDGGPNDPEPPP